MKRIAWLFIFVVGAAALLQAQGKWTFRGTVVKMQLTECMGVQRGFLASMSGGVTQGGNPCPEYTVLGDKVVYVVLGRRAEEFIPLSENRDFLIRKNELVIFSDDEKTVSRFVIEKMTLRSDWERDEARKDLAARVAAHILTYDSSDSPQPATATNAVNSNAVNSNAVTTNAVNKGW